MVSNPTERVLKLISAALNLQQAGEAEQALEVLERAQHEAPGAARVYLLSGLLLRDAGRLEKAESQLRRAIDLEPDLVEAIQSLGLLLFAQGRATEAAKWLRRHLELEPADPITLRALSTGLPRLGRDEEAVQILDQAWRLTRNPEAGIIYGRHLIRVGRWDEAEAVLQQVSEEAPQPRALVEWAYALAVLKQYEAAERVLLRIIDIDPNFDRAWRGLTECYIPIGRYEDALRVAEQALDIDDHHCRNWLAKANALLGLERYAEAHETTVTGIECVPRDDVEARPVLHELYLQSIETLFRLGRAEDALAQLDAARRAFPTSEVFVQIQTSMLNRMGRVAKALAVLEEARDAGMSLEGSVASLYYETLLLAGRHDEARAFVEPLLSEQPEQRLQALSGLGLRLYEWGRIDAARAVFEQLHAWVPSAPGFASNLSFILIGEGEMGEAEGLLLQALKSPHDIGNRSLILANLGYLRLVRGNHTDAGECLAQAMSEGDESEAILRIAIWQAGKVLPDPVPHPTRCLPISMAVQANQVTLALAQGQVDEAERLAWEISTNAPEASWGPTMLGWVLRAKADREGARQAWQQALEFTEDPQDQEAIAGWLASLPDDS